MCSILARGGVDCTNISLDSASTQKTAKAPKAPKPPAKTAAAKRTRRTGDELVAFRQMLANERNGGMPVAALAKQHGVSTAYIYSI